MTLKQHFHHCVAFEEVPLVKLLYMHMAATAPVMKFTQVNSVTKWLQNDYLLCQREQNMDQLTELRGLTLVAEIMYEILKSI